MSHPDWWLKLTPEQRVTQYNRHRKSWQPEVKLSDWDARMHEAYSMDPYQHARIMLPCLAPERCECQTCSWGNRRRALDKRAKGS